MADLIGNRHPSLQRLRRLSRRRSARTDEGAFIIDGPTLLAEALVAGAQVDEVIAEPGCPEGLLADAAAAGAIVHRAPTGALARVVDTVTPHGVAAIARLPNHTLDQALPAAGGLALVLVGVGDPGNAGTLLRSAEAAGARAVVFCDDSVDPFGPKCVRSSAGSVLRLAVVRETTSDVAFEACADGGLTTIATVVRGGTAYDEADLRRPIALVLGSEAHGLPDDVSARVDEAVSIPMAGPSESLNVAMAGTILCFEALRQRRAAPAGRTTTTGARHTTGRAAAASGRVHDE